MSEQIWTPGSGTIESRGGASGMNLNDSVYERLLRERIVFLGTQVDDPIANQICAQLLLLAAEDPERDIYLYINSPGGSVSAGSTLTIPSSGRSAGRTAHSAPSRR